ncbi:hypothetical protein DY000_02060028 [Brassica cretica]|uniref:MULE transposase domain-containing protein n=1 Tax=Brassica cretica TaxID=69181 RepID=A0ABQ7B3D8_BRACR|nr:hypothetical protein DY000_02060028 [Brassica cretica]
MLDVRIMHAIGVFEQRVRRILHISLSKRMSVNVPSSKTKAGKTTSAKTIGSLIMHKYEGVKDWPKFRGILERSYGKILKYLHMLRVANPGTHSSYEIDSNGRFRYLFIAFGQSIRGFNKVMRRVIVLDGTFLKSKYKGALLVAIAVDGNSNLFPIAFGIVDSENEWSWIWFMRKRIKDGP